MKTAIEVGNEIMALRGDDLAPVSKNMTELLVSLLLFIRAGGRFPDGDDERKPEAMVIAEKRLQYHGVAADGAVPFFISVISDRPGTTVLYCALVRAIAARKSDGKPVTLEDFINVGMPTGVPTEDALRRIWDNQKRVRAPGGVGSDNWLDEAAAWT